MGQNRTDQEILDLYFAMSPPRSQSRMRRELKVGDARCRRLWYEHELWNYTDEKDTAADSLPARVEPEWKPAGNFTEVNSVSGDIKDLDDLLATISVDLSIWECHDWTSNKWQVFSNEHGHQDLWQVKAKFRRKVSELAEKTMEWTQERLAGMPVRPMKPRVTISDKQDCCLEIAIMDPHLGKLAWGQETGYEDYDLPISASGVSQALSQLYEDAPLHRVERVLLPIGNDLFHTDTIENTTTRGTRQDVDSRWKKVYLTGLDIYEAAILHMAESVKVDVVIVPGNHDFQKCFYFGETLKRVFANNPNVTVDNSANEIKYYRYGVTQLGFAHGNQKWTRKAADAALRMAKDINLHDTKFHEWHFGDLHHFREIETMGVRCRTIPSLAPPDQWHSSNNFVHNRRCAVSMLWDRNRGPVGEFYFHP